MADSYFIGGKQFGLQKNVRPFWLPDQAYQFLENCFAFRERVQKKPGYSNIGRLRRVLTTVSIGNISAGGAGTFTFDIRTALGINVTQPNSELEPGDVTSIVIAIGAPISQTLTCNNAAGTFSIAGAGLITAASINFATTVLSVTFSGAAGASAATITGAYYPALPVMGLRRQELTAVNVENTIAFDTIYSYGRSSGEWIELPSTLSSTWSGDNYNLFWTVNYFATVPQTNVFWATNGLAGLSAYQVTTFGAAAAGPPSTVQVTTATANNFALNDQVVFVNMSGGVTNGTNATVTVVGNPFTCSNPGTGVFTNGAFTGSVIANRGIAQVSASQNGIRYYDASGTPTWYAFNPALSGTEILTGALVLLPFKGRLLAFNTIERTSAGTDITFRNRVRASVSFPKGIPLSVNGWRTDIPGNGFFLDAPTSEAIVSADFLKDRLIVYFERSTWELVYTGIDTLPFFFRKLNRELGAESTFSLVPFDSGVFGVANIGIHTCNGVNVERIDVIIPDEIYRINNEEHGPQRVVGIRDYQLEMVYWTYPDKLSYDDSNSNKIFPNRVFAYNYRNNSWAQFDESFTCYGYYQPDEEPTWDELTYNTWDEWNTPWDVGLTSARNLLVAAGNQQGFTMAFDKGFSCGTDFINTVTAVASVSNGTQITSPNHNLVSVELNAEEEAIDGDFVVFTLPNVTLTHLNSDLDSSNSYAVLQVVDANNFVIDATFTGTYVGGGTFKKLFNFDIVTKDFNPFMDKGQNVRISTIDFLIDPIQDSQEPQSYDLVSLSGSSAGPPSITQVTTSEINYFNVNNRVVFNSPSAGVDNHTIGLVTAVGNPFTVSNPGTGVFSDTSLTGTVALVPTSPPGFAAFFYLNDSETSYIDSLSGTHEIDLNASSLVPIQTGQSSIWKRKNINAIGQFVQIELSHSAAQMRRPTTTESQFVLHAIHMRASPSGRIAPS